MSIPWLKPDSPLPPTASALGPDTDAPGLLAAGGGLSIPRLRDAYAHGVFPWYGPGRPVLWWSPDPRMLLRTADLNVTRSLRKTLRRFLHTPGCEVRFDHDTPRVMRCCAETPRAGQDGTWIVPRDARGLCRRGAGTATSIRSRPGSTARSPAACTASTSGG
jgi:leucyl/phenylalanyl-tRNA--protein transferase